MSKTRYVRRENNVQEILSVCKNRKLDVKTLTDYHYRISNGKNTLDVYPTNRRYHNINTNRRGGFHVFESLVDRVFGKKEKNYLQKFIDMILFRK